jgi:transcriptional regulator with XRE-family HTH domain
MNVQQDAENKQPNTKNKIKMVRESINLSQEYVANKLHISQQAYSRMEKNPDNISVARMRDLSAILGVPFNTLVGEDDLYIQQNYNQQGGNAGTVMYVQGMAENERKVYEERINDLKQQIEAFRQLLLALNNQS